MDMRIDIGNSQLIVCDTGHKHILIFSVTGECFGTFDIKGICRNITPLYYSPCSITFDVNGFILISWDVNNCHLRICDRGGNCIQECGSKGDKPGQFLGTFDYLLVCKVAFMLVMRVAQEFRDFSPALWQYFHEFKHFCTVHHRLVLVLLRSAWFYFFAWSSSPACTAFEFCDILIEQSAQYSNE